MKFNYALILISISSFLLCSCATTGTHDGNYVFTDSSQKQATHESISIRGNKATLRFRSIFNQSKRTKDSYLCFQHADKIDLYISKRFPPIRILITNDGNILLDNKLFTKQQVVSISNTPITWHYSIFTFRKYANCSVKQIDEPGFQLY